MPQAVPLVADRLTCPDAPGNTTHCDRGRGMSAQVVIPAGGVALPQFEATTTRLSPSGTPTTGDVRCCPILAPVVVRMITGSR